jgi:hypothetical protein
MRSEKTKEYFRNYYRENREKLDAFGKINVAKRRLCDPLWSEKRIWYGMKKRCTNPNSKDFVYYGGRGIGIDPKWAKFADFIRDMGARPSKKHSIDRIDNNKNYGPGNCRWATQSEQLRNSRKARHVTAFGKTQTLTEWSLETRIKLHTILSRLDMGWTPEDAVSKPVRELKRKIEDK